MKLLPKMLFVSDDQRQADYERELIRHEAKIGGRLFGTIPKGHQREFFCLDERTWIWHEKWCDKQGKNHSVTTRYEARHGGVVKSQNGQPYQNLSREEAHNLYWAVDFYSKRMSEM